MKNKYIDIIIEYAKNNNISPAMAYKDLVLKDKDKCLQYSEAIEVIYKNNITTEMCLYKNYLKEVQFMLYEVITKILDKSKEKGVDVLVARDMLIAEDNILEAGVIRSAYKKLSDYYTPITTFRRENKPELIKELCTLIEADDNKGIKSFLNKYEHFIEESLNK